MPLVENQRGLKRAPLLLSTTEKNLRVVLWYTFQSADNTSHYAVARRRGAKGQFPLGLLNSEHIISFYNVSILLKRENPKISYSARVFWVKLDIPLVEP